ncbi:hypothetical protein BDZ89DRAFT_1045427 [Hymenopellis radicata]|nr:hypothetical protein BDZ89DRAFT_1045427 [Hymenopellis radicata]
MQSVGSNRRPVEATDHNLQCQPLGHISTFLQHTEGYAAQTGKVPKEKKTRVKRRRDLAGTEWTPIPEVEVVIVPTVAQPQSSSSCHHRLRESSGSPNSNQWPSTCAVITIFIGFPLDKTPPSFPSAVFQTIAQTPPCFPSPVLREKFLPRIRLSKSNERITMFGMAISLPSRKSKHSSNRCFLFGNHAMHSERGFHGRCIRAASQWSNSGLIATPPARIHPPKDLPQLLMRESSDSSVNPSNVQFISNATEDFPHLICTRSLCSECSIGRWSSADRYPRGHINAGRVDMEAYLVQEDGVHSDRQLFRAMATLSPSTVVHPSLDYESTMTLRENESALLFDLHWSQDPFDGGTDLPLIDVPSQKLEIGHNRFSPEQLRCANNCSADWGSLFDDAMRSKNLRRIRLRERQLFFEINRRWPIPAGPQKMELQANRLRVWIKVMWFFHMMRCLRFGLCAPPGLAPSLYSIERILAPASPLSTPIPPSSLAGSSLSSSGPTRYTSRVLPALDAEMARISGHNKIPPEYQINDALLQDWSVIPVAERLERLERRRTKVPRPIDSRHPFYLRNPRIAPYPLPVPPRQSPSRSSEEDNVRLISEALARPPPAVHYSSLGSIPPSSSTSTLTSGASCCASSSSQADTAPTVPNSPVLKSSDYTNTNILHSHPTDPVELLSRLGSRSSPGIASDFEILIACLKRVLPNQAVTDSCQFLVDELSADGIRRAHSKINSLERVANRLREVIADELRVRRDALRRRESLLVSNWEDEYLANAREDKEVEAEVEELLQGRRPTPSPPPPPRHEHPYFVSSVRLSGLRAPPTSRIGPPPPLQPGSPTPSFIPGPPPPSPTESYPPSAGGGPVIWDDAPSASVDPDEPDVDEDKVITSSFYQDLARDISVDASIDSVMLRTLTQLAEGTPDDILNKCVDSMLEEAGS